MWPERYSGVNCRHKSMPYEVNDDEVHKVTVVTPMTPMSLPSTPLHRCSVIAPANEKSRTQALLELSKRCTLAALLTA